MKCSTSVMKYLLMVFNLIFVICGLGGFIYGLIVYLRYKDHDQISFIAIGAIMLLISFCGCCGVIKESPYMLVTFAILLILMFIVQIVVGGLTFSILPDAVNSNTECKNELRSAFYLYMNRDTEPLHKQQRQFHCCGLDGADDFKTSILPSTCCEQERPLCTLGNGDVITQGCLEMCDNIIRYIYVQGLGLIFTAIIEIMGAILAVRLSQSIRNRSRLT